MADVGEFLHEVVDDWWRAGRWRWSTPWSATSGAATSPGTSRRRAGTTRRASGVQSARNIVNLAARACAGLPGVAVRGGATLEAAFAGRVLHVGKATPEQSRSWDVWSIDWLGSDVRDRAAELNTEAYLPFGGTLLDGLLPDVGSPAALSHLHLAWQGFVGDASTRSWVGFPRAGSRPWFAVLPPPAEGSGCRDGLGLPRGHAAA